MNENARIRKSWRIELNRRRPRRAETAAALKLTEEHRVQAQQKAEERAIAEKGDATNKRAEEADAKASAVKKVSEEKSALAAYEAAKIQEEGS